MNAILLTTDTPHHRYLAEKLWDVHPWQTIIIEKHRSTPAFSTHHPFEDKRDEYEREVLKGEFTPTPAEYERINDPKCITYLESLAPDLLVAFGTGPLSSKVIKSAKIALNLHGGNPEKYRGLDSHLWAIYHRDFGNLVTTLHFMDEGLDTGSIVSQRPLPITHDTGLHQLRAINTYLCVDLVRTAIGRLKPGDRLPFCRQKEVGRYYSFMPSSLKETCLKNFDEYVRTI